VESAVILVFKGLGAFHVRGEGVNSVTGHATH